MVIGVLVAATVIYMFMSSNYLKGQNIFCEVWTKTIVIINIVEPIYMFLAVMFNKKYSSLFTNDD